MGHILTFTISEHEFRHIDWHDDEAYFVRDMWSDLKFAATVFWRGDPDSLDVIGSCPDEPFEIFAVFDPDGEPYGIWSLYRINEISSDTISALCSPTFPSVAVGIPAKVFSLDGVVINQDEIEDAIEMRELFWRQTFACIESMLTNPMRMADGTVRAIDHFRFPSVSNGDPVQHEWSGVKDQFDRYCKIEVEFDENDTPVKTLPGWKSVDPDPERNVGEFGG
jgi:hypothetical protein